MIREDVSIHCDLLFPPLTLRKITTDEFIDVLIGMSEWPRQSGMVLNSKQEHANTYHVSVRAGPPRIVHWSHATLRRLQQDRCNQS